MSNQTIIAGLSALAARCPVAAQQATEAIQLIRNGALFSACDALGALFDLPLPATALESAESLHAGLVAFAEGDPE